MFITNPALSEAMLGGVKTALDGGTIYIFAGPVPATPDDALDMATQHTQLARLSLGGAGAGITFSAPDGAVVSKNPAETWSGLVAFDGADDADTTLTPSFFRFVQSGDTGRGAGTTARLQGSVGGLASTADMKLGTDTLTDNGSNTTSNAFFNFTYRSWVNLNAKEGSARCRNSWRRGFSRDSGARCLPFPAARRCA